MATSSRNSFSRFCGAPSISKRESFFGIRLGPYEPQARDVLFGAAPLSSLRAFQVIAQRYPVFLALKIAKNSHFLDLIPAKLNTSGLWTGRICYDPPRVRSVRLSD